MSTVPLSDLRHPAPFSNLIKITLLLLGFVAVGEWIYSGTAWTWLRPALHKELINKYAGIYHLDPLWIMAIIKVESRFSPAAQSRRGAVGLMQILPSTARDIGPETGLSRLREGDLKNPDTNLNLGMHYLSKLRQQFPDDEIAVLAAYNAGPGITREWRKGRPVLNLENIEYPETRRFVRQVQGTYSRLKAVQRWKRLFGMDRGN